MDIRETTITNDAKTIIVLADVVLTTLGSDLAGTALAEARDLNDSLDPVTDQDLREGLLPETIDLINSARRALGRAEMAAWEAANADLL